MPGLDGLRAVAVLGVIIYHLGARWLPGGLLGVGVFFTLSGYLITDLLVGGWERTGRLKLGEFWARRARRLLPALVVLLAVVVTWVAVGDPTQLASLRAAAISGLFYVNNWWQIAHHMSYFARFGQPSPLGNLWSLAVEEQFYLVWPWIVLAAIAMCVRRARRAGACAPDAPSVLTRRVRSRLALAIGLLAAASALEMALLYHPSFDPTRVYDGTDTRAFGLLVGAALAVVWPTRDRRPLVAARAALLDAGGVAGLVAIGVLMWRTDQYSSFMYRGGLVLLSLATSLVLMAATHPSARLGRVLGVGPLRWVGMISYGIYLWHYPVIVLTTPAVGSSSVLRPVVQVLASVGIAAASWYLVESPIRSGALGRAWARLRQGERRPVVGGAGRTRVALGASVGAASTAVAVLAFTGALPAAPAGVLAARAPTTMHVAHVLPSERVITVRAAPADGGGSPRHGRLARERASGTDAAARTSCTSVVHIGDSTSESLVSSTYLPAAEQLPAQYARVGVTRVVLEISGARSLVETLPGQQNGTEVAQALLSQGYRGCWVIALGTNDAANIAVGSPEGAAQRIDTLMTMLHGQPVLWVNAVTELAGGPYAEANMALWDAALVHACRQFKNLRVYDWASGVQPSWFISDGIHYNTPGSAARAAGIANALAAAFPSASPGATARLEPRGCVVH